MRSVALMELEGKEAEKLLEAGIGSRCLKADSGIPRILGLGAS
jgi:hypothetical protein